MANDTSIGARKDETERGDLAYWPVPFYNESTTEEVNNRMADQQQHDLLRQGVDVWNAWRDQHPKILIQLSEATLSEADLSGADLSGADLSEATLIKADLSEATLSGADLSYATLIKADLSGATLSEATLSEADLSEATLSEVNLSRANLSKVDLSEATLSRADLSGADLSGAILRGAHFTGADLSGADLSFASVGWTIFGNVDLRTAKGLETVFHNDPSTIGTDTLLRSEGNVPEKFLREAGLSDTFITYVRSLVQNPIEYYTCFISYSSKDQEFVESLYANLQAKGVRCWYAPEDMKIGDKIRQRIDESIRLYDKLLLVLSEQSVKSAWVEYEVEAALAKERRESRTVLFPIRLDTTVMESHTDWADHIRETRHIGDFTRWKGHDAYQKGLKRLLRDLQPDNPPTSPY